MDDAAQQQQPAAEPEPIASPSALPVTPPAATPTAPASDVQTSRPALRPASPAASEPTAAPSVPAASRRGDGGEVFALAPSRARDLAAAVASGLPWADVLGSFKVRWADVGTQMRLDPEFRAAIHEAEAQAERVRQIRREAEADRRAVEGIPKPVWYKGERVGVDVEFSDKLLEVQLRAGNPDRYADRQQVQHTGGIVVVEYRIDGVAHPPQRGLKPDHATRTLPAEAVEVGKPAIPALSAGRPSDTVSESPAPERDQDAGKPDQGGGKGKA